MHSHSELSVVTDATVVALTCADADASPNSDMTVTIASGDDATNKFKVAALNILTTGTATDYETTTSYTLVVNIADGGTTPNVATATVVVSVRNIKWKCVNVKSA